MRDISCDAEHTAEKLAEKKEQRLQLRQRELLMIELPGWRFPL